MDTTEIASKLHKNYDLCIKKNINPTIKLVMNGVDAPKDKVLRVFLKEFRETEVDCEPEFMEKAAI